MEDKTFEFHKIRTEIRNAFGKTHYIFDFTYDYSYIERCLQMDLIKFQNTLVELYNASKQDKKVLFKSKKDALKALEWMNSVIMANKLGGNFTGSWDAELYLPTFKVYFNEPLKNSIGDLIKYKEEVKKNVSNKRNCL